MSQQDMLDTDIDINNRFILYIGGQEPASSSIITRLLLYGGIAQLRWYRRLENLRVG